MRRLACLLSLALAAGAAPLHAQNLDCDGYLTTLVVPDGFCVRVFARDLPPVRHLMLHPSGTLVAAIKSGEGLLAMTVGRDGRVGKTTTFGPELPGTGVTWGNGWLYFAADEALVRMRWPADRAMPDTAVEWLDDNLPLGREEWAHRMKGVTLGRDGVPYLSFGAATDNCQVQDREARSPGQWPCRELETRAGIWRFTPGADGIWLSSRFATGLRNAEAIGTDPVTGKIWAVSNARDFLARAWGWPAAEAVDQPAETLFEIRSGGDYGWPYCMGYWGLDTTRSVLSPEYEGRGVDCNSKVQPVVGFPGGWAPMSIAIPATPVGTLGRGIFVAFHGSRSHAPLPEGGHQVAFVPMDAAGVPQKKYRPFLYSLEGAGALRPMGMAVAPDGILYVGDDEHGVIYRIEPHAPMKRSVPLR